MGPERDTPPGTPRPNTASLNASTPTQQMQDYARIADAHELGGVRSTPLRSDLESLTATFDERFNTAASRHSAKIAAVSGTLGPTESVVFITEGTLTGSFRADLYVITDVRLLIVRDDGARIDSYSLADLSAIHAPALPNGLEVHFGEEVWSGSVSTARAAIVFVYAISSGASAIDATRDRPPIHITPPSPYPTTDRTAMAPEYICYYGGGGAEDDELADWLLALSNSLSLEEMVLGLGTLDTEDDGLLVVAITTDRLVTLQRELSENDWRLLPVPGDGLIVNHLPLDEITEVELTVGSDDSPGELVVGVGGGPSAVTIVSPSTDSLELLQRDLRTAVDFRRSKGYTRDCPSDPFYWPAQALDQFVLAAGRLTKPDSEVRDPALGDDRRPIGHLVGSMPTLERNRLVNDFALAYGFDLSTQFSAIELLTVVLDEGESLYCLTQTAMPGESKPVLLALTDDWMGNDTVALTTR